MYQVVTLKSNPIWTLCFKKTHWKWGIQVLTQKIFYYYSFFFFSNGKKMNSLQNDHISIATKTDVAIKLKWIVLVTLWDTWFHWSWGYCSVVSFLNHLNTPRNGTHTWLYFGISRWEHRPGCRSGLCRHLQQCQSLTSGPGGNSLNKL